MSQITTVRNADLYDQELPGLRVRLAEDQPMVLDCGVALSPVTVAYQTYGTLNADRTNAVLICHALTGDQFAAEIHPITGKSGWWSMIIGSGKPIDTDRYFVICANVLGGCMGSTGPLETNPATGKPWILDFPVITVGDMVRAQKLLIDHLGIEKVFCVIGGSMGAMQVLQWVADYPDRHGDRGADRRARRGIRPRTSPSTRSAARRSWPIRTGAAATTPIRAEIQLAACQSRG